MSELMMDDPALRFVVVYFSCKRQAEVSIVHFEKLLIYIY